MQQEYHLIGKNRISGGVLIDNLGLSLKVHNLGGNLNRTCDYLYSIEDGPVLILDYERDSTCNIKGVSLIGSEKECEYGFSNLEKVCEKRGIIIEKIK